MKKIVELNAREIATVKGASKGWYENWFGSGAGAGGVIFTGVKG